MKTALFMMVGALLTLPLAAGGAQTTKPENAKPEQTVTTIVGCLVQGNPAERGEGRAANANDYFVRTPAITVPAGATVTVGGSSTASGATGRATTSAGAPTETVLYRISGLDRDQLRPHVGHRVELQGHLTGHTEGSTTTRTTVDQSGRATTRSETRRDMAGVLHATTIKMVSATCS